MLSIDGFLRDVAVYPVEKDGEKLFDRLVLYIDDVVQTQDDEFLRTSRVNVRLPQDVDPHDQADAMEDLIGNEVASLEVRVKAYGSEDDDFEVQTFLNCLENARIEETKASQNYSSYRQAVEKAEKLEQKALSEIVSA